MILSPLVGFILGYIVMVAVHWIFRKGHPGKLNRGFRWAQTASAAAMSVGHGMQDAAKTIGIVVLALYIGGYQEDPTHIPEWAFWTSAAVLAAGTYAGGWRIIRTLGRKIIDLRPPEGFAAETVASGVLYFNALVLARRSRPPTRSPRRSWASARPSGSPPCAGAWPATSSVAWILTFPAAGSIGALMYFLVRPLFS